MIIISAGMQKSGSAYFYNIINGLVVEAGNTDTREIKAKYGLDNLMRWHNNNIGKPSLYKLFRLWVISNKEGNIVVKTHSEPTASTKILCRLGVVKIIYSYRDPRDALLSAIDHGKKIIASGENHTFADMVDFDKALKTIKVWLNVWKKYEDMDSVLTVKYEQMMENPTETTKAIEKFLNISIDDKKREELLWKFSKDNSDGDKKGMHFNKAKVYRYKSEMTPPQKIKFIEEFREYIEGMSYDLD